MRGLCGLLEPNVDKVGSQNFANIMYGLVVRKVSTGNFWILGELVPWYVSIGAHIGF